MDLRLQELVLQTLISLFFHEEAGLSEKQLFVYSETFKAFALFVDLLL